MKVKNSEVTFWFQKIANPKEYVEVFNDKLNEFFYEFTVKGVPADISAFIPRMSSISKSSHSVIEVSQVNAKLRTNFDSDYFKDYKKCLDYVKERALKLYEVLNENNINCIYTALFMNFEEKDENAVSKIQKQFLKEEINDSVEEMGIRYSQTINDKYYKIITYNNSFNVQLEKVIDDSNGEILLPLISLKEASSIENYLNFSIEINDKLSFNVVSNYKTSNNELQEIFALMNNELEKELKKNN